MTEEGRLLAAGDVDALDELLAGGGLEGTFARHQLRLHAPGEGLYAFGWPCAAPFRAALLAADGVCWLVWRDKALLPAVARQVRGRGYELLSGASCAVEAVLNLLPPLWWRDQDRCPFEMVRPAALLLPGNPPGPAPRRATLDDMEALIDFYGRGFYSLARLPSRDAWRHRLTQQIKYRTLFIVAENGLVRAAAMSSAETPDHAMLGGVATLESQRNRGYSTAVVRALCADLFSRGCREIGLFYMPGNAAAARVYEKLGFKARGEWWLTRLRPVA